MSLVMMCVALRDRKVNEYVCTASTGDMSSFLTFNDGFKNLLFSLSLCCLLLIFNFRNQNWPLLAAADDDGAINLFNGHFLSSIIHKKIYEVHSV